MGKRLATVQGHESLAQLRNAHSTWSSSGLDSTVYGAGPSEEAVLAAISSELPITLSLPGPGGPLDRLTAAGVQVHPWLCQVGPKGPVAPVTLAPILKDIERAGNREDKSLSIIVAGSLLRWKSHGYLWSAGANLLCHGHQNVGRSADAIVSEGASNEFPYLLLL